MIDEDHNLTVPKRSVTVELTHAGRAPARAVVYVAELEAQSFRHQGVIDLLEHESAFLPARGEGEKTPTVFNKLTLVCVSVQAEQSDDAVADEDSLFEYRREVRVELVGGGTLQGELLYTLPAQHARVADYLNTPGRFFSLWTTDRLYLVNKSFVERVVETPLDLET